MSDDQAKNGLAGSQSSDVEVIKASYALQDRVGEGPLDQRAVDRAQHVMDNNDIDFSPVAKESLDGLKTAIDRASEGQESYQELMDEIIPLVMQLKAHSSVFNYDLIGNMANIMLGFLENVSDLDGDVLAIVSAHHTTLSAIVDNKMSGDGGVHGQQMEQELKGACERYFVKRRG